MPITNETLNNNLYDNLYSQGYDPDPLDSIGNESDIDAADVFRLKYKDKDGADKNCWMAIVDKELILWADNSFINLPKFENFNKFYKKWAQLQTLEWKVTNRDRLVSDMKKRTAMKKKEDQLNEGYYALGKQRSYSDSIPTVKLIIQHTRQLEEGEQRFRNIAKIFVENAGGERFLLPTNRPGLARVFGRHIAEGGTPYDDKGRHITSLVEEYTQMAGFVRATRNGQFNESALRLVNEGLMHYNNLRMTLQGMSSHRGYNKYFESYTPVLNEETDDDVSLNELFVEETLDPRIESVMPILKRLSKNINEMNEVKELDEWAKSITEVEDETTKTLAEPATDMLDEDDIDDSMKEVDSAASTVKEAPGAMTLKHNQNTEKSNLKAFDLGETDDAEAAHKKINTPAFMRKGDKVTLKDLEKSKERNISGKEGLAALTKRLSQIEEGPADEPEHEDTDADDKRWDDIEEGLDPAQKSELADLIDQYQSSTDPEADYYYDGDVPDSDEILNTIRQKFGDKIADTLDKGTNKMHYGRDDKDFGYDPLADRKGPRVTKSGMANKQDIQALKNTMKDKNLFRDKVLKPNLPEEVEEDLDANQKRVGQLGPTEPVGKNEKNLRGKLVGASESVELSEMDKSQPSSDRGGESSGDPYAKGSKATPVKAKDAAKDAGKELNKAMDKAHKKDVKEGQEDLDAILRIVHK